MTDKKKPDSLQKIKEALVKKIQNKTIHLESLLTRFLESNTRRDRDAVIKRKAEILTLKTILRELF